VYASVFFVDVGGFDPAGLSGFGPDDDLEVVSTLGRYGHTMLDGTHFLYPADTLPQTLDESLPPAPGVRLSNVLVGVGAGADDLEITTPANARVEDIPALQREPDSYRIIKEARHRGFFFAPPENATRLWEGTRTTVYPINPDRDLNGVGLLYFCNYVAFMDLAERSALEEEKCFSAEALDGRTTVRRRIGYYGNAQPHDIVEIEVEAFHLAGEVERLLFHYRVRRRSDARLIAVSSAEKLLRKLG
jgi:probable biosynthetic protein (TIGR04098 family)